MAGAALSRRLAAFAHRQQRNVQWQIAPIPQRYDPYLFLYHDQAASGRYQSGRSLLASLCIPSGGRVLDLCCGDGLFTRAITRSAHEVIALDYDAETIEYARQHHPSANIEYLVQDARAPLPAGPFDTVVWVSSLAYFTAAEAACILECVKASLAPGGILFGCTSLVHDGSESNPHRPFFRSKEDLAALLSPYWRNVKVFSIDSGTGPFLYFLAGDGVLPFDPDWPAQIASRNPVANLT